MEIHAGDVLVHPQGTIAAIRTLSASVLEFEATAPPGQGLLPEHAHEGQVETFRIQTGRARYRLHGVDGTVGPGDEVVVPAGARHVNPWNDSDETLVFTQRVEPVLDFLPIFERLGFRHR